MGDEEGGVEYSWTSLEPAAEGEEPLAGKFVKAAGRARVAYPNGDTYEGGFNDAKQKHGRGTYVWSTNAGANAWVPEEGYPEGKAPVVKYDGQYVEGHKSGVGKMSFPNGDRYHGQWEKDRFHGEGTYYYSNGDIYSGSWSRGVKAGEGVMMFAKDDCQLVGRWERGKFVSGKWVMKDGTSWSGPFRDGKPAGRGVFYFPSGGAQEGEYVVAGDPEDPDAEVTFTWKGAALRQGNVPAADVIRAPVPLSA